MPEICRFYGIIIRMYAETAHNIILHISTPIIKMMQSFTILKQWVQSQASFPENNNVC